MIGREAARFDLAGRRVTEAQIARRGRDVAESHGWTVRAAGDRPRSVEFAAAAVGRERGAVEGCVPLEETVQCGFIPAQASAARIAGETVAQRLDRARRAVVDRPRRVRVVALESVEARAQATRVKPCDRKRATATGIASGAADEMFSRTSCGRFELAIQCCTQFTIRDVDRGAVGPVERRRSAPTPRRIHRRFPARTRARVDAPAHGSQTSAKSESRPGPHVPVPHALRSRTR